MTVTLVVTVVRVVSDPIIVVGNVVTIVENVLERKALVWLEMLADRALA